MSSKNNQSYELRSSRDRYAPQDDPPPPAITYSHVRPRSSVLLGLYIVIPALITVSAITLGLKAYVATRSANGLRAGRWYDLDGVSMSQWPSTLFPVQDEPPLAVAALALATAVFLGALLLLVVRNGHLQASFSKRLAILVHVGLTAVLALVGTIYAFVLNDRSTFFDLDYAKVAASGGSETFTYSQGRFSKEVWACTVSALPLFDKDLGGAMSTACSMELGSRWMMMLTFLLSVGLFALLYIDSRGGRYFMRS